MKNNSSHRGLALIVMAFMPFLLVGAIALAENPVFFTELSPHADPDSVHYWRMADNLARHFVFSRSESPPFIPDDIRVPVYPMFLAIFRLLSLNLGWVYLVQGFLYTLSCFMLYKVVLEFTDRPQVAIIAYIFMATNISAYFYCLMTMSEIVFLFLFVAYMYLLVFALKNERLRYIFASALILGLMTLTKPVTVYLIYIEILLIMLKYGPKSPRKYIKPAAVAVLGYILLVGPWIGRNVLVLGMPRISVIDTHNMIYFVGSSAYIHKDNISLQESWNRISTDFSIPSYTILQNIFRFNDVFPVDSYKYLYRHLDKDIKWKVLSKYPLDLIEGLMIGFFKSHIAHNTGDFGDLITGRPWIASGTSENKDIIHRILSLLHSNNLQNDIIFIYELMHLLLLYILVIIGGWIFIRDSSIPIMLKVTLLLLYAYSLLNIVGAGINATDRFRMLSEIFYFVFGGFGLSYVLSFFGRGNAVCPAHGK